MLLFIFLIIHTIPATSQVSLVLWRRVTRHLLFYGVFATCIFIIRTIKNRYRPSNRLSHKDTAFKLPFLVRYHKKNATNGKIPTKWRNFQSTRPQTPHTLPLSALYSILLNAFNLAIISILFSADHFTIHSRSSCL